MADMLSSALEYARRGWYVFPCREKPGDPYVRSGETIIPKEKQPYVGKGLHEATRDEEQIRAWWGMWNDALIGVNAGKSGLFVVDIDKKHVNGFDTYSQWGINDIAGLQTITPSGGMHIIFTGNGKTSTNPNTGIDTRGEGGYFIAPPSEITGGEFIGIYKAYNDWSKKPGIIPDGLLSKLFPDNTVEYVRGSSSFQPDGKKQLSRASLSFLTNGAPEGGRNTTLFKVLADFAGCGYTMEEAREIVKPASTRTGLPGGEFEQVLSHAFSKPRTAAIPDSIQEKIMTAGKKVASQITHSEQEIIEDALIACMLIDNTNIPIINDILSYEDFQGIKNRIIYKAINQLYQTAGGRIDYLVAYDAVSKETSKITLEDISSLITKYFIDTDNAIVYANIIKEKSAIRKIEAMLDDKEKYLIEGSLLEIVTSIEQDLTRISLDGGARSSLILDAAQATEVVKTQTEKILKGELQQLKIGFPDYDNMLGGFYPNELVIIAGRAGEGKSALALSILNNVGIIQNKPSLMFSLEMSTTETICRLICQLTGLRFKDVYQGNLTVDEWKLYRKAVEQISDSKLYFDDGYGLTVPELRSKIRKLMDKDLSLVVVDQLEQIRGYEGLQTHLQFDKIAYDIKNMTLEFNVPIILNHQLNRGVTDRRLKNPEPILSDLNQAGEKPANQVWAITHHKDEVSGQIVESKIKILKNRNGPRFDFPVLFLGERLLFVSPTREEDSYSYEHRNRIQRTFTSQQPCEEPDNIVEDGDDSPPWY